MSFVKYSCSKTYTKPRRAVKTVCCPTIGSQLKTHSRRAWSRRDCRFVPIFHMNQPVFCNAQVYGKLLLLALHFVSPNFNNSLCNNLLRKTPIFRWQWTWSRVWTRHRLAPTAIRRQPEAVSFVRKTARPGGCAPVSPRETSQEGWKKNPDWITSIRASKLAASYSPTWCSSTIGVSELNFSVRNGKRWILTAVTTVTLSLYVVSRTLLNTCAPNFIPRYRLCCLFRPHRLIQLYLWEK